MDVFRSNLPPSEIATRVKENWCWTQVNTIKFDCTWTINNFSYCYGKGRLEKTLKSTTFSAGDNKKWKWYLELYTTPLAQDYVSLTIIIDEGKKEVNGNFTIYILNAKKEKIEQAVVNKSVSTLSGYRATYDIVRFLKKDYISLYPAHTLLPNDTLTILCELSINTDIINISSQSIAKEFQVPECQALDNLGLQLENEKFCDVTLTVRDKEFRAHKVIIAAQSPVFSAMFEHNMEESKKNHVVITDVDAEVLREVLRFIYTGKVANLNVMAKDLLAAADKYALKRLKVLCEKELYNTLTCENAADMLILADLYCSDQLKSKVLDFMNICADVVHTAGFKSMIQSHPHLVPESLQTIPNKRFKSQC
ncbi:PREDICTED: speckle-type POZ protein A-like [Vollenhovia emeryi]|uniref:speckle-type POZ protein A-like n=1 Tax=Vollenhovia emeryi TaxID=411798 RepID=UPI0005F38AC1|nr:PREDICTED: speckle-type POZ protein A-like [Vollenhovia emeryi]